MLADIVGKLSIQPRPQSPCYPCRVPLDKGNTGSGNEIVVYLKSANVVVVVEVGSVWFSHCFLFDERKRQRMCSSLSGHVSSFFS